MAQARIAGTEVIERQVNAKIFDVLEHARDRLGILQQRGLGDLQFEGARLDARLGKHAAHAVDEVFCAQFDRRNVDCHAYRRHARIEPRPHLAAALAQHPSTQRHDESGFLGDRHEFVGRNEAANRMPPTDEHLGADDPLGDQVDTGLIVQDELLAIDRAA